MQEDKRKFLEESLIKAGIDITKKVNKRPAGAEDYNSFIYYQEGD